jgi:hypothetical protein
MDLSSLPAFDSASDPKILLDYYQKNQILLIRNGARTGGNIVAAVTVLIDMYHRFRTSIDKNWSIENAGTSTNRNQLSPLSVLTSIGSYHVAKKRTRNHHDLPNSFYVSCILQSECNDLQSQFLAACPYAVPPFFPQMNDGSSNDHSNVWGNVIHSTPIWLFMGRHHHTGNTDDDEPVLKKGTRKEDIAAAPAALTGRVEHTDSVNHSGTWHHQLSGSKTWYVRPLVDAKEWRNVPTFKNFLPPVSADKSTRRSQRVGCKTASNSADWRLRIECQTGDLLLINTRLWWHCTSLPLTTTVDVDSTNLSVSFARDFYCPQASALLVDPPCYVSPVMMESSSSSGGGGTKERRGKQNTEPQKEEYCNVDGIYAAKNVRKGQVTTTH